MPKNTQAAAQLTPRGWGVVRGLTLTPPWCKRSSTRLSSRCRGACTTGRRAAHTARRVSATPPSSGTRSTRRTPLEHLAGGEQRHKHHCDSSDSNQKSTWEVVWEGKAGKIKWSTCGVGVGGYPQLRVHELMSLEDLGQETVSYKCTDLKAEFTTSLQKTSHEASSA